MSGRTRRTAVAVTAAMAVVTSFGGTAAAADVPLPGEPWIAFQAETAAGTRISLIRPDGTGEHLLVTQETSYQNNPDWSPDGESLTFTASDGDRDDLWIVGADGSGLRLAQDCRRRCAYLDDPAWSPDGRWIAVSRSDKDGRSRLDLVSPSTGATRTVLGPWRRQFTAGARWSPDASELVFELVRKSGPTLDADVVGVTLTRARLSGGRLRHLTDPLLFAATADWSPDGRWIAYSALPTQTAEAPDLFVIHPDGTSRRRVTWLAALGGYAAEPTWVGGSHSLVFSGSRGVDGELLRVCLATGAVGPATGPGPVLGRHPRWRADSAS